MKTFTDQRLKDELKRFNSSLKRKDSKELVIFWCSLFLIGLLLLMSI